MQDEHFDAQLRSAMMAEHVDTTALDARILQQLAHCLDFMPVSRLPMTCLMISKTAFAACAMPSNPHHFLRTKPNFLLGHNK